MLGTLLKKKTTRTPVGLDIGARGLRAAQLSPAKGGWTVVAASACERTGVPDGTDVLQPSAQLVRMVTSLERFRGREVVAVMSSPDLDYFSLELPKGVVDSESAQLERVVCAEVSRLMRGEDKEPVTRYWRSPAGKPPSPNVVGIGASPVAVRTLLTTMDEARLICSVVEPAALALARFGSVLCRPGEDELWGVLDLGEREARLVVCLGRVPVLVRAVGGGVGDWTRSVAATLDVGEKSAEVHLREHGVAAVGGRESGEQRTSRGSLAGLMMGGLRSSLRSTTAEAERSVAYMRQCYPGRDLRGLIAVGRGSLIPNVVEYFSHSLGIEVMRASACLRGDRCELTYSSGHGQPLELVGLAIGTALSE